jgi:hypothetical protein
MLRTTCAISLVLLHAVAPVLGRQNVAHVPRTQEIPRNGYKTWSLFLICTPGWVRSANSDQLRDLHSRFQAFGDAIGSDNLAVWFWKADSESTAAKRAEDVDVARSAEFCRSLRLRPSEGPHLVVTTAYPDLRGFPADRAVFTLGGLSAGELTALLNRLTDQLLLEGKVESTRQELAGASPATPPNAESKAPSGLWLRLLEGARLGMLGVRCSVGLKINAGVLSAELRACPG